MNRLTLFVLGLTLGVGFAVCDVRAQSETGNGSVVRRESGVSGVIVQPQDSTAVQRSQTQFQRSLSDEAVRGKASPEQLIGSGWEHFKNGQWSLAEKAFKEALTLGNGEASQRARMGLGFASVRLGNLEQARDNFRLLVDSGYNLNESLPALLTALKALGDRQTLEAYAARLPEGQRSQWAAVKPLAPVETPGPGAPAAPAGVRAALAQAGDKPGAARLADILARHQAALNACEDGDVFLKIAQGFIVQNQALQAKPVLGRLVSCPRLDFGVRLGAFYELAAVSSPEVVRDHLHRFQENAKGLGDKQRAALAELSVVLDKKEMGGEGVSPARRLELAGSILRSRPSDPDARAVLAWEDIRAGRPGQALEVFREVAAQLPGRADLLLGQGYALYGLGRLDEALSLARSRPDDPSMKDLAYQVHVKQAFAAVENKDYALAESLADKAAAVWPDGAEIREVRAWALLGRGQPGQAYALFERRYKETGDKRFLAPMLLSLTKDGQRTKAFETAAVMTQEGDAKARQAAGTFYQQQGAPILAAKADPDGPSANADTAMIEARGFVRSKTGDSGLSRLTEWTAPSGFSLALPNGWRLGGAWAPSWLSSGNAPSDPYAGSFYARVSGRPQRNSLVTETLVHTPSLSLDIEGPYLWRFEAGTTPLGGPVGVMPTFLAQVSAPNWELRLHQRSVTESILSWIGQRDPYGSKPWGRVLRTGASGVYVLTPWESWFVSLGGGADYYWGQNVADNVGLKGNLSAGRTFDLAGNELALGGYATLKHFGRNANFYTYGHGGYYSPDVLFIAGPFVRLRSPQGKPYWFDLEGSVGSMYESTADAPKYPLKGASALGLTTGQIEELGGRYSGKTETKFAYSAKGEFLALLGPHVAAGVFGGLSNAADFREAYVGMGLRVYFDPQKGFWAPKSLFKFFTPMDRDN